jgi:hypothetical protein
MNFKMKKVDRIESHFDPKFYLFFNKFDQQRHLQKDLENDEILD